MALVGTSHLTGFSPDEQPSRKPQLVVLGVWLGLLGVYTMSSMALLLGFGFLALLGVLGIWAGWGPPRPRLREMAGPVAVLGWGSLLWEDRSIFDEWHDPWEYDGPSLRIEFSRVSSSRGGALTLVIDPENGTSVRVAWCLTRRQTINEAIKDLCKREGTKVRNIGMIAAHGRAECHDHESLAAIRGWAAERKLDGVVWTDLRTNFAIRPEDGRDFLC
jgi:hypothetical protein